MKKGLILMLAGILILALTGPAAATTFGLQTAYAPTWADGSTLVNFWQNNDTANKSQTLNYSFTETPGYLIDQTDVFFQFIYYRDPYLSGTRYSSGIDWTNYPSTDYQNYTQLTPSGGSGYANPGNSAFEVVAFSVELLPDNAGLISVSADVSYHWDPNANNGDGAYVGSDDQWLGEIYMYARTHESPVPEPSTMLLLGAGLLGLAGCSRKRLLKK